MDADADLHVLELKRDRTPSDTVAQALDYGSSVKRLTLNQVSAILPNSRGGDFEGAFARRFNVPLPDMFNTAQQLTIEASELDPASERIVTYLPSTMQSRSMPSSSGTSLMAVPSTSPERGCSRPRGRTRYGNADGTATTR